MVDTKNFRAIAKTVAISNLYLGKYIEGNENHSGYLELFNNKKIIRVNIIGTVVMQKNLGSITILKIDDGSDIINLRFFEDNQRLKNIEIGKVVLVIGKIREYNAERYIAAEIIKNVKGRWLKYRSLLLQLDKKKQSEIGHNLYQKKNSPDKNFSVSDKKNDTEIKKISDKINDVASDNEPKIIVEDKTENDIHDNPYLMLMSLISKLDSGTGVALEVVIHESKFDNTEELLKKMMESGDIFQNVPGKFKIL